MATGDFANRGAFRSRSSGRVTFLPPFPLNRRSSLAEPAPLRSRLGNVLIVLGRARE
jgi:hypothetical protein